jgi:hypothetical protein
MLSRNIFMACAITALTLTSYNVPSSTQNTALAQPSITGATTDLLMSNDMADFITTCPHEEPLDETDME